MIVEPDFVDHWKTRMLVGLLGDDEMAPIYLIRLWAHCQQRKCWTFSNLPAAALRAICRAPCGADILERGLSESGFLLRDTESVVHVVGWDEHNASLIANWKNGAKGATAKAGPKVPTYKLASDPITSTEWNALRKAVIERDGQACAYCNCDLPDGVLIDHIIPTAKGGTNAIENLCVCCRQCNTSKKDRTVEEWRGSNPAATTTPIDSHADSHGTPIGPPIEKIREEKMGEEESPHTPQAGRVPRSTKAITLLAYIEQCKTANCKPIPADDSVFDYAAKVGLSKEFLLLNWLEMKERYALDGAKKYKSWPVVFGKSVRGNWFRLWYALPDGSYALTTTGQQAKRNHGDAI